MNCSSTATAAETITSMSALRCSVSVTGVIPASANAWIVVHTAIPASAVRVEVMMEVPITKKDRSIEREERRIESPTKRTVEDSVARNERVRAKPRIPIPARAVPSKPVASASNVTRPKVYVGFREICGAQAAPVIQIARFISLLVEALRLRGLLVQSQLVAALHRHLSAVIVYDRFAVENAHLIVGRIKIVIPVFHEFGRNAVCINAYIILFMNLGDFDTRFAFLHPNFGVGKAGRNHLHRAVASHPQENAGREQHFCFSVFSCDRLARLQNGLTNRF